MFQKSIVVILLIAFVNLLGVSSAFAKTTQIGKEAARVKKSIQKIGVGEAARVKIKLTGGAKLEGYVSQANEDSFVVKNPQTGRATEVAYENVKKIYGDNFSTGAKIGIGIVIAAAVIAIVVLAKRKVCRNSLCQ